MRCPFCGSKSVIQCANSQVAKGKFSEKKLLCLVCHQNFGYPSHLKHLKRFLMGTASIILLSPLLLEILMQAGLSLLPKDQGKPVESILILGRGEDYQTERAVVASQLWEQEIASHIFVSGMSDAPRIMKTLRQMGVPEEQISGERCSQTTWENGLFSDYLINNRERTRILLVTDEPHIVRAFLVFEGFGFDVIPHPVPRNSNPAFSLERLRILVREHTALVVYAFKGKLRPGSVAKQQADRAEASDKIINWKCHLK